MISGYKTLRQLRYLRRYRQILQILVKHGFAQALDQLKLYGLWEKVFVRKSRRQGVSHHWETRLRMAMEELGPAFVKVGQLLSTRTDMLPPALINELKRLQDRVTPFPEVRAMKILEEELGASPDQIFASFDPEPLAAASIGQVHRATLNQGGEVVVKIKRPGVDRIVAEDLAILVSLAEIAERNTNLGQVYQFARIADELRLLILRELDYFAEARNAQRFRQNFDNNPRVYIPRIYWDFTTHNVLTMEFIEGINLGRLSKEKTEVNLEQVVETLTESFFKQVFIDGFFHGDPHPGNIALLSDGRIGFMDFGSAGFISEDLRARFVLIFLAFQKMDPVAVVDELLTFAFVPPMVNRQELIRDIGQIQEQYYDLPLRELDINAALQEIMGVAAKHRLRFPYEFLLLVKALLTLEGTVTEFQPDFNIAAAVEKYGPALQGKQIKYAARRVQGTLRSYRRLAEEFPGRAVDILREAAAGEFKLKIDVERTDSTLRTLETMVNRLAFSIVLASLIIALSQIFQSGDTFLLSRLPLGDVALVGAGLAGVWWLFSIIRSGRF